MVDDLAKHYKSVLGENYQTCYTIESAEHISAIEKTSRFCAEYNFGALPYKVEQWRLEKAYSDFGLCMAHAYFSEINDTLNNKIKRSRNCYKLNTFLKTLDGTHPALSYVDQHSKAGFFLDDLHKEKKASMQAQKDMRMAEQESALIEKTNSNLDELNLGPNTKIEDFVSKYGSPDRSITKPKFSILLYQDDLAFLFNEEQQLSKITICRRCAEPYIKGDQHWKAEGISNQKIIKLLQIN